MTRSIKDDDEQSSYICGNCKYEIFYLSSDEPTVPCPECGYIHKERSVTNVPSEIKLDLTQY